MVMAIDWVAKLAAGLGVLAVFALIGAVVRRGWLPSLPAPQAGLEPTARDRRRYHAAGIVACAIGVFGAVALYGVPPLADPGAWFRQSFFDHGGRLIAPLLFGLALAAVAAPWFASWWIAPGPFVHLLARESKRMGGADPRHLAAGMGHVLVVVALALHFTLRAEHATFTGDGVRWRDWLAWHEHDRPWADVSEIRLVRFVVPLVGGDKERPHLALVFRDGEVLRVGTMASSRTPPDWEAVAADVARRTHAPIRRVDRN